MRGISPWKLNVFIAVPVRILAFALRFLFKSSFGDKSMYRHSMKARDEMIRLHREFYGYVLRLFILQWKKHLKKLYNALKIFREKIKS